ncbi:MAG TPA: hypothetical protein G4O15_13600 [Dehalococcoidia bacterium]|nr:hypothetical protein [Dehalococcoidia bacterium]
MLQRLLIYVFLTLLIFLFGCHNTVDNNLIFKEDFEKGILDSSRWKITTDGDFADYTVDVCDVDISEKNDFRLRLQANTLETSDPLKYLGVRSKEVLDLNTDLEISFDVDWNDQANGCYLTASLYLCPTISENPKNENDWLKFEYTGVPPGRNVRINIWEKINGAVIPHYTDWGPRDEKDKPVGKYLEPGKHTIKLVISGSTLKIFEDDNEIYYLREYKLSFTTAYIYLQMSSGTNYPARTVYFDNISVKDINIQD